MWAVVDAIGNLLGPLWPDWLDGTLDAIYNALYLLHVNDCSSIPQRILEAITHICE